MIAPSGCVDEHRLIEDDTVLAFIAGAYDHFEVGTGDRPHDVAFHADVTQLILAGKEHCARHAARSSAAGLVTT